MKVTIIRHGMTEKRKSGQDDIDRPLMKKCEEFIPRLGKFDAVFSSPARRCIDTAKVASGETPVVINALSTHLYEGVVYGSLPRPSRAPKFDIWELVEKCYFLPDGSMAEIPFSYVERDMSSLEKSAWRVITQDAWREIKERRGEVKNILIATHQFHAQKLALEILGGRQARIEDFVRQMYLPPGGTITLEA